MYSSLVKKNSEEYELYKKFLISLAGDKPSIGLTLMCAVLQTPQISRHPSINYLLKVILANKKAVFGKDPKLYKILDDPTIETKDHLYSRLTPFLSENWKQ